MKAEAIQKLTIAHTPIRPRAYMRKPQLEEVAIGQGVPEISDRAFLNCQALKRVVMEPGVTRICRRAFAGCNSLTEIVLPDGLETIEPEAFENCTALEQIQIPASVREISWDAFRSCCRLKIDVHPDNPKYRSTDGMVVDRSSETLLFIPESISGRIRIPDGVKDIPAEAFRGREGLYEVILPDSVESVGKYAFADCTSLDRITFPTGLRVIPDSCCMNCGMLSEIVFPERLETIEACAFLHNQFLFEVTLPETLRVLSGSAFTGCNLVRLNLLGPYREGIDLMQCGSIPSDLYLRVDQIPLNIIPAVLQRNVVADYLLRVSQNEPVPERVEQDCLAFIRAHRKEYWDQPICQPVILQYGMITRKEFQWFLDRIGNMKTPEGWEQPQDLRERLLRYRDEHGLGQKETKKRAKSSPSEQPGDVWKSKPWNSTGLYITGYQGADKNVVVPAFISTKPVAAIGSYSFCTNRRYCRPKPEVLAGREAVQSIRVEEGITELAEGALAYCPSLQKVTLPESLRIIGGEAFCGCEQLKKLTIPEHVVWIEGSFIQGCRNLKQLIIRGSQTVLSRNLTISRYPAGLTVKAPKGSQAQYWANENELRFEVLD